METYERIKELRKNHLKLSQAAFGEKLGVNRDVINNIENNRLAKPDQKLSLIKLMCKEFSVSEEWLLNGSGSMYVEPDAFSLDGFMKSHDASDIELEIVKAYFEIDVETRKKLIQHFKERILYQPQHPETPEELERLFPPVEDAGSQAG